MLRALIQRLSPRRAGLRLWLGLSYGVLALLLAGVLSVLVERAASAKLQEDIGLRLASQAHTLADRLDEGLYERLNDMRQLSLLPMVRDPERHEETLRDTFSLLQLSYREYAWIGVADAEGRVEVAARGLLEGADVGSLPWFIGGRRAPFVGDLHEAVLLARVLPVPSGRPLRLVDVAAPVHDEHGVVVGVIGAHLSWEWAEQMRQALAQPMQVRDPSEVFVVNEQGEVILGPAPWIGQRLALDSERAAGLGHNDALLERWPDGRDYLTGFARTVGRDTFPSLGWRVLVRKDAELAFEPVRELRLRIWLTALVASLAFLLLAALMARWIGAPLRSLAVAAGRLRRGEAGAAFPPERGYREARELTRALQGLVDELTAHERELLDLARDLEQRVRERTLALSEANAQLEVLAMTDPLTGLANRRHFGDQLAREVVRAAEGSRPLSLLVLDIDHFKAINDGHGHPAGDAVLRRVALALEEAVRGGDLLARVGGEEFAVLAVDTALADATRLAERLRLAVEQAGPVQVGRAAIPVTASVGVAVLWARAGDALKGPERLLAAADDALYRAKRGGRNRVEVTAP